MLWCDNGIGLIHRSVRVGWGIEPEGESYLDVWDSLFSIDRKAVSLLMVKPLLGDHALV